MGVLADWPLGLITWTLHTPAGFARVVARSCVELTKVTPVVEVPPIKIVAPETKPLPVTVIRVPPDVGPRVGETAVAVGPPVAVVVV